MPRLPPLETYSLAGLQIASEITLPGSLRCRDAPTNDNKVVIRHAEIPELVSSAVTFQRVQYDGESILISIPDIARFMIRDRKEILVEAAPGSYESDITAFLLGTVFGALCHQRGIVPMHASAIDNHGSCALFAGHSGAGKSTLAAALAARGHEVISDDVCFLREDKEGNILVWPGIGRIRLWDDSLDALNYDRSKIERELRRYDKFEVPVTPPREPFSSRPLGRIYQLRAANADETPHMAQIRGARSIELLLPNVYRLTLAERIGAKPNIFSLCAAIARSVPTFEFHRPFAFKALPSVVGFLEEHLRHAS